MKKMGYIAITVGFTIIVYLLLLITIPILVDFATTANTTMAASSNMTNYPGTSGALMSAPWVLWFVPGALCIVVVIAILRQP